MDLTYTPKQDAFRREAREWLAAHVPKQKLASMDTGEGFIFDGNVIQIERGKKGTEIQIVINPAGGRGGHPTITIPTPPPPPPG